MKSFQKTFLSALNRVESEPKEFTIVFLSRPLRRGQRKIERSTVITAVDRFTAYKTAVERYGRSNVLKTSERSDDIRTDNFVTVL